MHCWRHAAAPRRAALGALACRRPSPSQHLAVCSLYSTSTPVVAASPPLIARKSDQPVTPVVGPVVGCGSANRADTLAMLEKSIAQKAPTHALAYFDRLEIPPEDPQVVQKLAVLVAKHGRRHEVPRAIDFLRSMFKQPELVGSDYTKLAAIYVADACLRHRMLRQAMDVYEDASSVDVVLDLPAYDALLEALVEADKVEEAVTILKDMTEKNDVHPTEDTYYPILFALMEQCEYHKVTDLLEFGRSHGVAFTTETYDPLVELGEIQEADDDNLDGLTHFMDYVNKAVDEDGLLDGVEDISIEFHDDDDDDDDDDDSFDGDDEFDD